MTDPAIAAAQRAMRLTTTRDTPIRLYYHHLLAAVREALAPLRELHREDLGPYSISSSCAECGCTWPCDSAKLIYPESELA